MRAFIFVIFAILALGLSINLPSETARMFSCKLGLLALDEKEEGKSKCEVKKALVQEIGLTRGNEVIRKGEEQCKGMLGVALGSIKEGKSDVQINVDVLKVTIKFLTKTFVKYSTSFQYCKENGIEESYGKRFMKEVLPKAVCELDKGTAQSEACWKVFVEVVAEEILQEVYENAEEEESEDEVEHMEELEDMLCLKQVMIDYDHCKNMISKAKEEYERGDATKEDIRLEMEHVRFKLLAKDIF